MRHFRQRLRRRLVLLSLVVVVVVLVLVLVLLLVVVVVYFHRGGPFHLEATGSTTANLRTKILNFRGFDSSRILISRGGIVSPIGNSPESLSQQILAGIILVGRLVVLRPGSQPRSGTSWPSLRPRSCSNVRGGEGAID